MYRGVLFGKVFKVYYKDIIYMNKYNFSFDVYDTNDLEKRNCCKKNVIKYKCLICYCFERDWDDAWDDAKKAEVKAEVDAHHNEHIIPETTDV